ncbi:MAG: MFS transporter [Methylococcaceae bacterium]|nr:MFS transporter [Methylococcaceae bacterium]
MSVPYWRLSGFYFFYFATLGAFLPYWNLYLKESGFNPAQIGELSALLAGTKIIAPNLWGWMADHTGRSLRIIRIASLFAALVFVCFLYVRGHFWFVWVTLGFSFFWNAALPQFEAVTLFHLKANAYRYSRIRLWGSVGFIVTVLGVGRILDDYAISILPQIVLALLLTIWLASLITPEVRIAVHEEKTDSILSIIKKPEILAFFAVYILLQFAHGAYYVFYSIYLKQQHYTATLTGLLWALGVVAEIVLFLFMSRLLGRFSLRAILLLSISLSVVRWLMIGWGADYLAVLVAAQLLHAATFGATHAAAIHLVHAFFGHRHQGKGQALYSSLSFGVGGMAGSLCSGYYWDLLGAQFVYSVAACCCLLALVIAYVGVGRQHVKMPKSA